MKKVCVLILSVFTLPVFGSGIASNTASAPCTNNTLETYSGNSNLQADWQPNEIQLRWYNGNTLLDVQSSANACVYDSTLTIPSTAPTRVGYTFDGWQVRPEMDFSTIPTEPNAIEKWSIGFYEGEDLCRHGGYNKMDCASDINYSELQRHEWKIKFEHGDLYGMSLCSTIDPETGIPVNDSGGTCWCKATGYKAVNSNVIKAPSYRLRWTRRHPYESNAVCLERCSLACVLYAADTEVSFRAALFTPAN